MWNHSIILIIVFSSGGGGVMKGRRKKPLTVNSYMHMINCKKSYHHTADRVDFHGDGERAVDAKFIFIYFPAVIVCRWHRCVAYIYIHLIFFFVFIYCLRESEWRAVEREKKIGTNKNWSNLSKSNHYSKGRKIVSLYFRKQIFSFHLLHSLPFEHRRRVCNFMLIERWIEKHASMPCC